MKITSVESLHADAGQRTFDFLKITTDAGLVGWSEYWNGLAESVKIAAMADTHEVNVAPHNFTATWPP